MALPVFSEETSDDELARMMTNAETAASFLKALSHEGRLMILCHLATGEKSVSELERLLSARQAAVSQQLTRLRLEGLVRPRREGKTIFYSLADRRAVRVLNVVYDLFCREEPAPAEADARSAAGGAGGEAAAATGTATGTAATGTAATGTVRGAAGA